MRSLILLLLIQHFVATYLSAQAVTGSSNELAPVIVDSLSPEDQSFMAAEISSLVQGNDILQKAGISSYEIDELGTTLFSNSEGRKFRLPPDELSPAADPNDFHSNPLVSDPGLSVASQPRILQFLTLPIGSQYSEALPTSSYALQLRPGVYYDTGAFESNPARFFPGNIALDNTDAARTRGNIVFNDLADSLQTVPLRAQINNTFKGLLATDILQVYADGYYPGTGNLRGRSYFARGYAEDYGFLIGKAETAFGDIGSAPMLVSHGALPIGAPGNIDPNDFTLTSISQLRLTRHWNQDTLETTLSLEESSAAGDVVDNGQNLHDWPAFVTRARYSPNNFDSFQVASMYRPIGFIDPNFVERNVSGWGVSFVGRKSNANRTRAIYFGAVSGEGIGGYIFGGVGAAVVTSPESISAQKNNSGYVAFQQVLSRQSATRNVTTNIAYGIVDSDAILATQNAQLQQAWCNLLWNATDSVAMGVEYQYGHRLIEDRTSGDNHRFTFIAQFTTPSAREAGALLRSAIPTSENRKPIQNRRL